MFRLILLNCFWGMVAHIKLRASELRTCSDLFVKIIPRVSKRTENDFEKKIF